MTQNRRRQIKREMREKDARCFYCATFVTAWRFEQDHFATLDHLWPKCRGGGDNLGNLVLACRKCNEKKAALTLDEITGEISFGIS